MNGTPDVLAGAAARPLPAVPPMPSSARRSLLTVLTLGVVFALAARVIELRPLELARDAGNIAVFLRGYLHPSFAHIGEYAWQCVVTACIALWGTLLAVTVSIPLGLGVLYAACRLLRVSELELATRSIVGPLRRRLRKR